MSCQKTLVSFLVTQNGRSRYYHSLWSLMREPMKTKNFYAVLLLVFVSLVAVWLVVSPAPDLHTIVSDAHKKISNLKSLRPSLKKPVEREVDEAYLKLLGFTKHQGLYPASKRNRATEDHLPVISSSVASGDVINALRLLRTARKYVPSKLVVFFDLGLDYGDLSMLHGHCNSTSGPSCIVRKFEFSKFPSHVQYRYMKAYRPLCIQSALREFGAVIWVDPGVYFISDQLNQSVTLAQEVGLAGWLISNPTSAVTHPKMFEYFKTDPEKYYFHHAMKLNHMIVFNTPEVHQHLMLPWVKCALTEDCINPTGAQNTGCNYGRRPFFRYSGCHHYDMSALNIVLGLLFNFSTQKYAANYTIRLFDSVDKMSETGARNISFIGGERYIVE